MGGAQPAGRLAGTSTSALDTATRTPARSSSASSTSRANTPDGRAQERDPALADQAADRARIGPAGRRDHQPRAGTSAPHSSSTEMSKVSGVTSEHHVVAARERRRCRRPAASARSRASSRRPSAARSSPTCRSRRRAAPRPAPTPARRPRHALRLQRQHRARPRVLEDQPRGAPAGPLGRAPRTRRPRAASRAARPPRRRALDVRRDHVARPHALAPQPLRDAVGARQQLAVGQRTRARPRRQARRDTAGHGPRSARRAKRPCSRTRSDSDALTSRGKPARDQAEPLRLLHRLGAVAHAELPIQRATCAP